MEMHILSNIGSINTVKDEVIKVNIVDVNRGKELIDISRWDCDGRRRGGVLLDNAQLEELKDILDCI